MYLLYIFVPGYMGSNSRHDENQCVHFEVKGILNMQLLGIMGSFDGFD
jgi:hypothetical protein